MGRYTYVVLTRSQPGREAEFLRWYDEQHLDDVARIPGIVAARRFNVAHQKVVNLDAPQWQSLAIYEIEADDPKLVLNAIYAASGTDAMPSSEAYNRDGLIEIIGAPVGGGSAGDE
jgi:hypothetical protein